MADKETRMFAKPLESIPSDTVNIEIEQETKSKFTRLHMVLLSIFLSAIIILSGKLLFLTQYRGLAFILVIAGVLCLFIVCAIASSLAYFIYQQLASLGIKVTQHENNLFYKIKNALRSTVFLLSLSLVSFFLSQFILHYFLEGILSILFFTIANIVSLSLFIYFYLLSLHNIITLIYDMIKHAHSVVVMTSTGKRSE